MRFTAATALALFYAGAVIATPLIKRQNDDDNDDGNNGVANNGTRTNDGDRDDDADDAVLYSPANLTQVNPGGTVDFSYICDDDDCTSVRVALIQYIEVAANLNTSRGTNGTGVTTQLTIPANLPAGNWVIGVDEQTADDDNDDDDDQNDDDDWLDYDTRFEDGANRGGPEGYFMLSVGNATA